MAIQAMRRGSLLLRQWAYCSFVRPAGLSRYSRIARYGSSDADWRLIVAVPGGKGDSRGCTGQCYIGLQGYFAGSLARASRTAPEPVKTPKMPFSTVTM